MSPVYSIIFYLLVCCLAPICCVNLPFLLFLNLFHIKSFPAFYGTSLPWRAFIVKHLQDTFINSRLTAEKYRKFSNIRELGLNLRWAYIRARDHILERCLLAFLSCFLYCSFKLNNSCCLHKVQHNRYIYFVSCILPVQMFQIKSLPVDKRA